MAAVEVRRLPAAARLSGGSLGPSSWPPAPRRAPRHRGASTDRCSAATGQPRLIRAWSRPRRDAETGPRAWERSPWRCSSPTPMLLGGPAGSGPEPLDGLGRQARAARGEKIRRPSARSGKALSRAVSRAMAGGTASGPRACAGPGRPPRGAAARAGPPQRQRRRQGRTVSAGCLRSALGGAEPAAPAREGGAVRSAMGAGATHWRGRCESLAGATCAPAGLRRWARSLGPVGMAPRQWTPRRLAGGPEGLGPPRAWGFTRERGPLVAALEEGRQGGPMRLSRLPTRACSGSRGSAADPRCIWSRHEELVKASRAKGTSSRRLRRVEVRGWIVSGRSPGGKAQQLTLTWGEAKGH